MRAAYLLKRFGLLLAVLWTAATLNFFLPRLTPRNPIRERIVQLATSGGYLEQGIEEMVKAYEAKFGLDQPLWKQYLRYLGDMVRLDLGQAISAPRTEPIRKDNSKVTAAMPMLQPTTSPISSITVLGKAVRE